VTTVEILPECFVHGTIHGARDDIRIALVANTDAGMTVSLPTSWLIDNFYSVLLYYKESCLSRFSGSHMMMSER
jgi:hypothetical protein